MFSENKIISWTQPIMLSLNTIQPIPWMDKRWAIRLNVVSAAGLASSFMGGSEPSGSAGPQCSSTASLSSTDSSCAMTWGAAAGQVGQNQQAYAGQPG